MKNLFLILFLFQVPYIFGQVDWTRTNTCEYKNFDNADLIEQLIDGMSIEEKVGQVIQGDLDFISPADVKKFKIGSVLNGGNTAPNGENTARLRIGRALARNFMILLLPIKVLKSQFYGAPMRFMAITMLLGQHCFLIILG